MRIGVLTGGGDCPGLNPAIRAIVMRSMEHGFELVGLSNGWAGLVKGKKEPLDLKRVDEIIREGGTILGSSRTNPFKRTKKDRRDPLERTLENISRFRLDAIIALGGEDTLGVAAKLFQLGIKTVGVPKTMDNDLNGTEYTFGFDSAVSVAVDACDRLKDTAKSHRRTMVLEVMGRKAGWVALYAGIAGGADWILIPEVALDLEEMCEHLMNLRKRGKVYSVVVASEGIDLPQADEEGIDLPQADEEGISDDDFGHPILRERRVGEFLAKEIEARTGQETRFSVLGHIVRGGSPTPFDRVLASRVGLKAADMVKDGEFGKMAALQNNEIVAVDLDMATKELKTVPIELYNEVKTLFTK